MGFRMFGMNGLKTLKKVQGSICDVPVMISAETGPDVMLDLQSTGIDRYFVSKSFDVVSLKQLVKQILASPARALAKAN
jgi:DNA-binding NarL/FixJ family response regulator